MVVYALGIVFLPSSIGRDASGCDSAGDIFEWDALNRFFRVLVLEVWKSSTRTRIENTNNKQKL